jgi:sorbitol-specific phosphotransferase system component IIBC
MKFLMNKKGRGNFEQIISAIFGFIIFIMLISALSSAGIFSELANSFGNLAGLFGLLIGIAIVAAIIKAIQEIFGR